MDAVPLDDRGLLLGDGLFETLLVLAGRPVFFEAHLARLARGCAVIGLPAPDLEEARAAIDAALDHAGLRQARAAVRLTWTAGSGGRGLDRPADPTPRLFAAAHPAAVDPTPLTAIIANIRRNQDSPSSRLKTLAYLDNVLARREASRRGAAEALLLNGRGELACAAAANLFWVKAGRLYTPALDCGVLDGIARNDVMRLAAADIEVVETHAGPRALLDAAAVFVTNSLIGVRALGELDGRTLGQDPMVARLGFKLQAAMVT